MKSNILWYLSESVPEQLKQYWSEKYWGRKWTSIKIENEAVIKYSSSEITK